VAFALFARAGKVHFRNNCDSGELDISVIYKTLVLDAFVITFDVFS
jgi:hypothetical protein